MRHMSTYWILFSVTTVLRFAGNATTNHDDVAVIVNTNSPTSIAIGNYFRTARSIPATNMIYVAVDTAEEIQSISFNSLRSQVEGYMTSNNLTNTINYLVTTKGIPLKVNRGDALSTSSPSASVESESMLTLGSFSSQIGWRMAEGMLVKLKVFDATARQIATLVDDVKPPGTHIVRFDADNLASGTYFCRLETAIRS